MRCATRKEAKMRGTTLFHEFVRRTPAEGSFLEGRKVLSQQHLSVALEVSALVIVWSAIIAISIAIAGLLLGEQ
jgi:hypothetical protein